MSNARSEIQELANHEEDFKSLYPMLYGMANLDDENPVLHMAYYAEQDRAAATGIKEGFEITAHSVYSFGLLIYDLGCSLEHHYNQTVYQMKKEFAVQLLQRINQEKANDLKKDYLEKYTKIENDYRNGNTARRNQERIDAINRAKNSFGDFVVDAVQLQMAFNLAEIDPSGAEAHLNSAKFKNAMENMNRRGKYIKAAMQSVADEFNERPTEFLFSLGTSWLLSFGGLKVIDGLANFKKFGTLKKPPHFKNRNKSESIIPFDRINARTLKEIRQTKGELDLLYGYTDDHGLIFAPRVRDSEGLNNLRNTHIYLTRGMPTPAAGEVKFIDGILKMINNKSGHHLPQADNLAKTTVNIFKNAGVAEATEAMFKNVPSSIDPLTGLRYQGTTEKFTLKKVKKMIKTGAEAGSETIQAYKGEKPASDQVNEEEKKRSTHENAPSEQSINLAKKAIEQFEAMKISDSDGKINLENVASLYQFGDSILEQANNNQSNANDGIDKNKNDGDQGSKLSRLVDAGRLLVNFVDTVFLKVNPIKKEIDEIVKKAKSIHENVSASARNLHAYLSYENHATLSGNDIFILDSFTYQLARMCRELGKIEEENETLRKNRDQLRPELIRVLSQMRQQKNKIEDTGKKNKSKLTALSVVDTALAFLPPNPYTITAKITSGLVHGSAANRLNHQLEKKGNKLEQFGRTASKLSAELDSNLRELDYNNHQLDRANHGAELNFNAAIDSHEKGIQDDQEKLDLVRGAKIETQKSSSYKHFIAVWNEKLHKINKHHSDMDCEERKELARKRAIEEISRSSDSKDIAAKDALNELDSLNQSAQNIQTSIALKQEILSKLNTPANRQFYEVVNALIKSDLSEAQENSWKVFQAVERSLNEQTEVVKSAVDATNGVLTGLAILFQDRPDVRKWIDRIRYNLMPGVNHGIELAKNVVSITTSALQVAAGNAISFTHGVVAFGVKGLKAFSSLIGIVNLIAGQFVEDMVLSQLKEIKENINQLKTMLVESSKAILTSIQSTEARIIDKISQLKDVAVNIYNQNERAANKNQQNFNDLSKQIAEDFSIKAMADHKDKISKEMREVERCNNVQELARYSIGLNQKTLNGESLISFATENNRQVHQDIHRHAGSFVGILNPSISSNKEGSGLPNADILSFILHQLIDKFNIENEKAIPEEDVEMVREILSMVDQFEFDPHTSYTIMLDFIRQAVASVSDMFSIYQQLHVESLFETARLQQIAISSTSEIKIVTSQDVGYTFARMIPKVNVAVTTVNVPLWMKVDRVENGDARIMAQPTGNHKVSFEALTTTLVPKNQGIACSNAVANMGTLGIRRHLYGLNVKYQFSLNTDKFIDTSMIKFNLVEFGYIGACSIVDSSRPWFFEDFWRYSTVEYRLLNKPVLTSSISDANFHKIKSILASNNMRHTEELNRRLASYIVALNANLNNEKIKVGEFGIGNGIIIEPDIQESEFLKSLPVKPLPLIFPKRYIEQILQIQNSTVKKIILNSKMEFDNYQTKFYYTIDHYTTERKDGHYRLSIWLKDSQVRKLLHAHSFSVDEVTLLAFKNYQCEFKANKKSWVYQGYVDLNKFLVLFMYGSLPCGLSIPSKNCVNLTGEGEYIYQHRRFVGMYKILSKMAEKNNLWTSHYDSNEYDDATPGLITTYLSGKAIDKPNTCVNRLLFSRQLDEIRMLPIETKTLDDKASETLKKKIGIFLTQYENQYNFILTELTILTSLRYLDMIEWISDQYNLPHPVVLRDILFLHPIEESVHILNEVNRVLSNEKNKIEGELKRDKSSLQETLNNDYKLKLIFSGEKSRYQCRLFKQASLLRAAINSESRMVSGDDFNSYQTEMKSKTMHDVSDAKIGDDSYANIKNSVLNDSYVGKIKKLSSFLREQPKPAGDASPSPDVLSKRTVSISGLNNNCGLYSLAFASVYAANQQGIRNLIPKRLFEYNINEQMVSADNHSQEIEALGDYLRGDELKSALIHDDEYKKNWRQLLTTTCLLRVSNEQIDRTISESLIEPTNQLVEQLKKVKQRLSLYLSGKKREIQIDVELTDDDREDFNKSLKMLFEAPDSFMRSTSEVNLFSEWKDRDSIRAFCHLLKDNWDILNKSYSSEIREVVKNKCNDFIAESMAHLLQWPQDDELSQFNWDSLEQFVDAVDYAGLLPKEEKIDMMLRFYCRLYVTANDELYEQYVKHVCNTKLKPQMTITADELSSLAKVWAVSLNIITPQDNNEKDKKPLGYQPSRGDSVLSVTLRHVGDNHWNAVIDEKAQTAAFRI